MVNTLLGQLPDVVTFTISPVPHMALHEGVQSERCRNHGARDTLRTFPQHSACFCPSHPTLLQSPGLCAGLPSASCSLPTISSRPAPMRHSGLHPVSPALTTLRPPCPSALSPCSSFTALTKHEDFSALKSSFIPLVAHCLISHQHLSSVRLELGHLHPQHPEQGLAHCRYPTNTCRMSQTVSPIHLTSDEVT